MERMKRMWVVSINGRRAPILYNDFEQALEVKRRLAVEGTTALIEAVQVLQGDNNRIVEGATGGTATE